MSALERGYTAVQHGGREVFHSARLLIAVKAAAAAVIAWFIAGFMPGSLDEFRYYAPLGALISMSPTLVRSVRAGLETLVGIALGIGIAWLSIITPAPAVLALFLAVGVGVLIAGISRLGAGADYVPIAALFVIVVGGRDAEDYSFGFLVQMAVGAAIGFTINLIIAPPLALRSSARLFSSLRDQTADLLDKIAQWLRDPAAEPGWVDQHIALREEARSAELEVDETRESRRLNPRALRAQYDAQQDREDVREIQQVITWSGQLSEALEDLQDALMQDAALNDLRQALAHALQECAQALRVFKESTCETKERSSQQAAAARAVESLSETEIPTRVNMPELHANIGAAVTELGRISALLARDEEE